jgi:hypothetical protein
MALSFAGAKDNDMHRDRSDRGDNDKYRERGPLTVASVTPVTMHIVIFRSIYAFVTNIQPLVRC